MNLEQDKPAAKRARFPWIGLAMPFVIAIVLLMASPNFQAVDGERTGPLGGDFIQEWIGGHLVLTEPDRLYDFDHSAALQHETELVGFDWPEKQYFPMVYPPFYYAAMVPLANLEFSLASQLWLFLGALALSFAGWLMFRFHTPSQNLIGIFLAACIVFTPLINNFNMGQKGTVLLLILTGTFLLLHHKRPWLAGMTFGLIAFKPHLGILIGIAMLLKGHWRFSMASVATVGVLVVSSWVWEPSWWPSYLATVARMGDYVQTSGYQLADSHSLWGALQLSLGWSSPTLVKVLVGFCSLGVLFLLWKAIAKPTDTDSKMFALQYSGMVLAMVLLSPHFYSYDLAVLLLPMLLIATSCFEASWRDSTVYRTLVLLVVCFFAVAGLFPKIASATSVQPSIFLMIGMLILIGNYLSQNQSPAETAG